MTVLDVMNEINDVRNSIKFLDEYADKNVVIEQENDEFDKIISHLYDFTAVLEKMEVKK